MDNICFIFIISDLDQQVKRRAYPFFYQIHYPVVFVTKLISSSDHKTLWFLCWLAYFLILFCSLLKLLSPIMFFSSNVLSFSSFKHDTLKIQTESSYSVLISGIFWGTLVACMPAEKTPRGFTVLVHWLSFRLEFFFFKVLFLFCGLEMVEVMHFIVYLRSIGSIDGGDKGPISWQISCLLISEDIKLGKENKSLGGNVRKSAFLDL